MTSKAQGKLTREDIDKVLTENGVLDARGQTRPLDRKTVELLIEKNDGPEGLDLSGRNLNRADLMGAPLHPEPQDL